MNPFTPTNFTPTLLHKSCDMSHMSYGKICRCKWIHENWLLKLGPLLYSFSEFRTRRQKETKIKIKQQEKQKKN